MGKAYDPKAVEDYSDFTVNYPTNASTDRAVPTAAYPELQTDAEIAGAKASVVQSGGAAW